MTDMQPGLSGRNVGRKHQGVEESRGSVQVERNGAVGLKLAQRTLRGAATRCQPP